jgi:hypothetical protein
MGAASASLENVDLRLTESNNELLSNTLSELAAAYGAPEVLACSMVYLQMVWWRCLEADQAAAWQLTGDSLGQRHCARLMEPLHSSLYTCIWPPCKLRKIGTAALKILYHVCSCR